MRRTQKNLQTWGAPLLPVVLALLLSVTIALVHGAVATPWTARLTHEATAVGNVIREGSLYVPRGGPTIVGFISARPATLFVGKQAIAGQGLRTERLLLDAGPVRIRFLAPPNARLVWSPVGRRGDPEYVPASSLSPESPATATFSSPGTARSTGLAALAIAAVWSAVIIRYLRRRIRASSWRERGAFLLVLGIAFAVRAVNVGAAGQTWDEDTNWAAGKNYISNWLELNFSAEAWRWNYEHPPITKYIMGVFGQWQDGFDSARWAAALCVALACALLFATGRALFGVRQGFAAGLVAALLPTLVAHGKVVGHESVTLFWWSLALYLAATWRVVEVDAGGHDTIDATARAVLLRAAGLGAVVGLAAATRFIGGAVLIPVVVTWWLWLRRHGARPLVLMLASAAVTFWAVWPRLWLNPFGALASSLAKLSKSHGAEPYLGAFTNVPGAHYFFLYVLVTVPLGVWALVACGGAAVAKRHAARTGWWLLAWMAAPFVVALSPVRQDGIRYVLPAFLVLALGAGAGLVWAARRGWWLALVAVCTYLAVTLARIHPYYLDYFNEAVGGPRRVAERNWFETAWWGEGLDRAVAYVNAHAVAGDRVHRTDACTPPTHLTWFRADLWPTLTDAMTEAQWIIAYQPLRHACRPPADAVEVFRVSAQGAPLAIVYRRARGSQ